MKVLLTGASGFFGKILSESLTNDQIITLGRSPQSSIICDLSEQVPSLPAAEIDYVIHAAGKAHLVPKSSLEEQEFFNVNYQGTINLTKALEKKTLPKALIFISTVAVYGLEEGVDINEECPLNGETPYARSKILAEQHLLQWGKEQHVIIGILRLPLIVGSNPKGNLGAMINGVKTGKYLKIGKGQSRKSMVLATDVAKIISQVLNNGGVYNLTDGYHPSFSELETVIATKYDKNLLSVPKWLVSILALPDNVFEFWPINSSQIKKITSNLTFCDKKAQEVLNWKPTEVLKELSKLL